MAGLGDAPAAASGPASGSEASISIDQASSLLGQFRKGGSDEPEERDDADRGDDNLSDEPTDGPEGDTDGAGNDIADEANGDEDDTVDASEEDQQDAAPVAPPASWPKEDADLFAKLPPQIQTRLAAREQQREQFVNQKAQETAAAKGEVQQFAAWAQNELSGAIQAAKVAIEGEFAGIDWQKLKVDNPMLYTQLEGMREQRVQGLQAVLQEQARLQHVTQQKAAQEHEAHLHAAKETAVPILTELLGGTLDNAVIGRDLPAYLVSNGVPQDRLGLMSEPWELVIATKAMLYDKMTKNKTAAAGKIKDAPTVQRSKGRPSHNEGKGNNVRAAVGKLEKSGSIDDAVAALRAMRGSK